MVGLGSEGELRELRLQNLFFFKDKSTRWWSFVLFVLGNVQTLITLIIITFIIL